MITSLTGISNWTSWQPLRHTSVLLSLQLPLVSGRLNLVTVSPMEWKAHSSHLSSPLFLLVDLVDPMGTEAPSPVVLVFVPSCYLSTMSAPPTHVLTSIKRCVWLPVVDVWFWHVTACGSVGPDVAEERAAAIQRRGGDAEDTPASEHSPLLRLLRRTACQGQEGHRTRHWTHDFRNPQNVSIIVVVGVVAAELLIVSIVRMVIIIVIIIVIVIKVVIIN